MNRYCPVDTIVNTDDNYVARDWLISNNIYTDERSIYWHLPNANNFVKFKYEVITRKRHVCERVQMSSHLRFSEPLANHFRSTNKCFYIFFYLNWYSIFHTRFWLNEANKKKNSKHHHRRTLIVASLNVLDRQIKFCKLNIKIVP